MKKYLIFIMVVFLPTIINGQIDEREKQTNEGSYFVTDTIKKLIPISKKSFLKDVDVIFNTRAAYESRFVDGNHSLSNFSMNQFRLEIKGKIHEKVYFRFRDRYTREPIPGNLDNFSRSVDLAFLNIDITSQTKFSFGKLCADWGGYEFDFNPIDILNYNDIIDNSDNFLVGAGISHAFKDGKNSISFQVLNSRTRKYEEQYGDSAPLNLKPTEFPLAFVTNWRSSFFNGKMETTYSYSFFNEAQGAHMNYIVLGNKFKSKKMLLYYDFHYSNEGLDRKGIISGIINNKYQYAAQNVIYIENWIRAEYLIHPKVNLLLSIMNSNHKWNDNPDLNGNSRLATTYGVIPTVEYFPFKDFNMKFYLGYVARKYDYTRYAENTFGAKDYTTGLLSFGFIAPLSIL
jgi:hypothetical protein